MFAERNNEQTRQFIDVEQMFAAFRQAEQEFEHGYDGGYRGKMRWQKRAGHEYLYRTLRGKTRSLGRRTPETEAIKEAYVANRTRLRERMRRSKKRLDEMARVNKALRINRVPATVAQILRRLDQEGLIGTHLMVAGTHSLWAYEAAAGVQLESGLVATTDVDLLWDARNRLKLASLDMPADGVVALLRDVDRTFQRDPTRAYSAANDCGFMVDIIRPIEPDEGNSNVRGLGSRNDVQAAAIRGLQWLINAPKFEHMTIDEKGWPVQIVCPDPRAFALHKYWLSDGAKGREPGKRCRDRQQALATAAIADQHLRLSFQARELRALPLRLVQHAKALVAEARNVTA